MIHVNLKEKCLVDGDTGEILRPECFDYLSQYCSFIEERGHKGASQSLLRRVFDGEKVISKMIDFYQKHEAKGDFNHRHPLQPSQ
jgi:hypothetical protein